MRMCIWPCVCVYLCAYVCVSVCMYAICVMSSMVGKYVDRKVCGYAGMEAQMYAGMTV